MHAFCGQNTQHAMAWIPGHTFTTWIPDMLVIKSAYPWCINCHWDRNMTEYPKMKKKKPPRDWEIKWHRWDDQSQYHDTFQEVQCLAD